MTPIEFKGHTHVLAKDQPEYQPLPVHIEDSEHCTMTSCWRLTWRERFILFFTGRLWLQQLTFRHTLQPQLPLVEAPVLGEPFISPIRKLSP